MLAIRQPLSAEATWTARGWPALLSPQTRPDLQTQLYWALTELVEASDAADIDAVENMVTEAQTCLDCLIRSGALKSAALSIAMSLWTELSRGVGGEFWDVVAHHANTLAKIVDVPKDRLAGTAPRYLAPGDRIRGGVLPVVTGPGDVAQHRPDAERLLMRLAAALAIGAGHLIDHATAGRPRVLFIRAGWTAQIPAGEVLGSHRARGADDLGEFLLRPRAAIAAINTLGAGRWTITAAGAALSTGWITDGSLVVDGTRIRRVPTQRLPLTEGSDTTEDLWVVPAWIYSADQFGTRRPPRRRLLTPR